MRKGKQLTAFCMVTWISAFLSIMQPRSYKSCQQLSLLDIMLTIMKKCFMKKGDHNYLLDFSWYEYLKYLLIFITDYIKPSFALYQVIFIKNVSAYIVRTCIINTEFNVALESSEGFGVVTVGGGFYREQGRWFLLVHIDFWAYRYSTPLCLYYLLNYRLEFSPVVICY